MKLETYVEIYGLWDRGYKQREIARITGVSLATVKRAISELKDKFPKLFPKNNKRTGTVQYTPLADKFVKEKL